VDVGKVDFVVEDEATSITIQFEITKVTKGPYVKSEKESREDNVADKESAR
jgi:hypothetical protein